MSDTSAAESALLRAVIADPDNDEPRLAYAAWLESHGRAERAELIRVQCQTERLHAREKELLDAHAGEWGSPLFARGADHWEFHRGFPEEVEIEFSRFLDNHATLAGVTPLRHLSLGMGTDEWVTRLAGLDLAKNIRSLEIGYESDSPLPHQIGLAGVRALASSPKLAGLQRLVLHSHDIGAAGAKLIAGSPQLTGLTHLCLDDPVFNRRGHRSLEQVAAAPAMAGLQELQVGNEVVGPHILRLMRESSQDRGRE